MYTPAPWKQIIAQPGTMLEIVNDEREYVCSLLGGDEYKQANAQLIAAAPELLDVLEEIADVISFDPNLYNLIGKDRYQKARTAIKKARGE